MFIFFLQIVGEPGGREALDEILSASMENILAQKFGGEKALRRLQDVGQGAPIDDAPPPALTQEGRERQNVTVQLEKYYVRLWDDYAHANRMNRTAALRDMILKLCRPGEDSAA